LRQKNDNGPYNIFAEAETTIEFFDLDPMQVVWHGNYFNYFEIARRLLLEKIGYGYCEMKKTGFMFPIIEATVKYINSLKHGDKAVIKAILVEYENRLKIKYEIYNAETGILTTRGETTQMTVDIKTGESCFVCPAVLTEKIENLIKGKV